MNEINTDSIKQLLNRSAASIDDSTLENLRTARARALEVSRAQQQAPVLAWLNHHGLWLGNSGHHRNTQWMLALLFAVCLFGGIIYMQNINEHDHSDIDIAILADDLPVDAYVE